MGSRFPATLVLWLGREFYKVKHGLTGSDCSWIPYLGDNFVDLGYHFDDKFGDLREHLATILMKNVATWQQIWRPWRSFLATWRQIDDSRKCNPFLDISIRKGNTLEYTRKLHVTSRPVGVYKDRVGIRGSSADPSGTTSEFRL
ncbi:hypothetical protein AVEN_39836-1 [Araneus ventricosus]|uniref:Uncharacterized protein n=1 Tax=Araneus ventricosus TaxID=182803 RepID=A0A4Y2TST1_ARAVE|nr:hypothetical protein AVEN_8176-1 [Araneus ventricosus]GBO03707.1 hypothetical protein AVEN_132921-1 [Araneus ventricosus]GBO03763.1 hypothetical protein AVEN_18486-1 [Araneus ventricosus]GBO03764.1 hypothetical protein AVEN_39836-1 [Araneus ventricosus]